LLVTVWKLVRNTGKAWKRRTSWRLCDETAEKASKS